MRWWRGFCWQAVNAVTEGPIARNAQQSADAARVAVIGEYAFSPVETDLRGYDAIRSVYAAQDDAGQTVGYVYELSSRGYAGDITLSVGVKDGAVSAVSVSGHTETKAWARRMKSPSWRGLPGFRKRTKRCAWMP